MFQTLVNVNSRTKHIWKSILKDNYTDELKDMYVKLVSSRIIDRFHTKTSKNNKFANLKEIFFISFKDIFEYRNDKYCPFLATQIFIKEHNKAELYDDSLDFLIRAKDKYKICLVSDTDGDMVKTHLSYMNFDSVFLSEDLKAYKGHADGKIFKAVLNKYNVEPYEVIHIGDSSSDICGGARVGFDTCWINRNNYKKRFDIKPTYEIESLSDLVSILKI